MTRSFQLVDVFGERPFSGNPLGVVLDADGLTGDDMQQFSRWMNHSETTFLLAPTSGEADYKVRIFTLARELPFAGHPTLGSCHAWLSVGNEPRRADRIVQECGAGLVPIRRTEEGLAFSAPPLLREGSVAESFVEELASVLGIERGDIVDSQWVDNGPGWVAVLLEDAASVLEVEPDTGRFTGDGSLDIGVVGPYPQGSEFAFEVRAFFTDHLGDIKEDPVTGSLNASLGQWLLATGRATAPYVASQGIRLGRSGRVHIQQDGDGTVWVGGAAVTMISGEIDL